MCHLFLCSQIQGRISDSFDEVFEQTRWFDLGRTEWRLLSLEPLLCGAIARIPSDPKSFGPDTVCPHGTWIKVVETAVMPFNANFQIGRIVITESDADASAGGERVSNGASSSSSSRVQHIEWLRLPLKREPIDLGQRCWNLLSLGPSFGLFELCGAQVAVRIEVADEDGTAWDWYDGTVLKSEARWNRFENEAQILIPDTVTREHREGPWHLVQFKAEYRLQFSSYWISLSNAHWRLLEWPLSRGQEIEKANADKEKKKVQREAAEAAKRQKRAAASDPTKRSLSADELTFFMAAVKAGTLEPWKASCQNLQDPKLVGVFVLPLQTAAEEEVQVRASQLSRAQRKLLVKATKEWVLGEYAASRERGACAWRALCRALTGSQVRSEVNRRHAPYVKSMDEADKLKLARKPSEAIILLESKASRSSKAKDPQHQKEPQRVWLANNGNGASRTRTPPLHAHHAASPRPLTCAYRNAGLRLGWMGGPVIARGAEKGFLERQGRPRHKREHQRREVDQAYDDVRREV